MGGCGDKLKRKIYKLQCFEIADVSDKLKQYQNSGGAESSNNLIFGE